MYTQKRARSKPSPLSQYTPVNKAILAKLGRQGAEVHLRSRTVTPLSSPSHIIKSHSKLYKKGSPYSYIDLN